MKKQIKNVIKLLGAACISSILTIGCSDAPDSVTELPLTTDSAPAQTPETALNQPESDIESPASDMAAEPQTTDNPTSQWHVLSPEVAAAVDADFVGDVWKINENSFFIAEEKLELLDDGSLLCSSPSTDADIPDSALIPVIFDSNTYFYIRTIYDGGSRYEDADASFQDLKKYISVEMKGSFSNDGFHASEIRLMKTA